VDTSLSLTSRVRRRRSRHAAFVPSAESTHGREWSRSIEKRTISLFVPPGEENSAGWLSVQDEGKAVAPFSCPLLACHMAVFATKSPERKVRTPPGPPRAERPASNELSLSLSHSLSLSLSLPLSHSLSLSHSRSLSLSLPLSLSLSKLVMHVCTRHNESRYFVYSDNTNRRKVSSMQRSNGPYDSTTGIYIYIYIYMCVCVMQKYIYIQQRNHSNIKQRDM